MEVISINNNYSSGFRRLVAWFIDHIIIGAALSAVLFSWWGSPFDWDWNFSHFNGFRWNFVGHNVLREFLIILYYAAMESSKYQATLGKIIMGIKVVDENNQRLQLPKALLRNLSKILSGIIFGIGYIMIIFDARKQGLHDKIADTFVVKQ